MFGIGTKKHTTASKSFEVTEGVLLECMKKLVKTQLQQNSDIASIQDQVVDLLEEQEERDKWSQSSEPDGLLTPSPGPPLPSLPLLLLLLFLTTQLLIQLAFTGHFPLPDC